MSRYIDADKLMIELNDWWYSQTNFESQNIPFDDDISVTIREAMEAVKEQPTADVRENVRGEWKEVVLKQDEGWNVLACECSVCGRRSLNGSAFCPWCGADMRPITALSKNAEIDSNSKRGES